jgi:polyvinyl alcohol dehydrogenase (cytochrome)
MLATLVLAAAAPAEPPPAMPIQPAPLPAVPVPTTPESNRCADSATPLALGSAQWNGWGRDIENTRYQPEPAIRATDVPKLALKWAFGFQGSAVAGQPTVVDGRLFVASATGRVYSLDATTGCTYWTFDAAAGIRTAISIGEFAPPKNASAPRPAPAARRKHGRADKKSKRQFTLAHLDIFKAPSAALFGDDAGAVYALDAQKGTLLWKTQVESHALARIVAAPTLYHERLYVAVSSSEQSAALDGAYACCTFRGSIAALDMTTGHVLWKTFVIPDEPRPFRQNAAGGQQIGPAGAAVSAAPTIDAKRNLLYVGTGGALTEINQPLTDAVVALDLTDGRVRWAKQFSRHEMTGAADFGSSPILRTLADGKQIILAGQKSGMVYALDPDHGGEVLWQIKVAEEAAPGGIEWGPAADHRRLYVALSGSAAEPDNTGGGLAALDMKTGAKRWYTPAPSPACSWGPEACSHAEAQAVTVVPGVAFSGSMDGHLRAYSTIDGKVLWDYETAKDFPTVNGSKASGGSLDQGGATIVNGVVYINSGYGQRYGQPGNVLLAFSVDGK